MGGKNDDHKANTSCHVQVLGVGADTGCTLPSVLLFFDRKRYLFNVGEGFQRFCVEHKVKMTKVSSVLSTRATTHALGGLPGMLLTMRDVTAGGLLAGQLGYDVHGPPGLKTASAAFKTFVSFKDLGLKIREQSAVGLKGTAGLAEVCGPVVSNESVTITPVLVWSSNAATIGRESGEPASKRSKTDGEMVTENGAAKPAGWEGLPVSNYVCQLPDIPGKFLPQKAASLGVPRGPLYGKLQKGESVEAANGKTVHPSDVMEPSTPGPTVMIIDCPTVDHIEGLMSGMGGWSNDQDKRQKVAVVIHLTSRDVLRAPKYVQFIRSFPDPAQHILVSESMTEKTPIMKKSALLHAKLSFLDPEAFQALHHGLGNEQESLVDAPPMEFPGNCRKGTNMLKYLLRPVAKRGFSDEECNQEEINHEVIVRDLLASKPGIEQIAGNIQAFVSPAPSASIPSIVTSKEGANVSFTFLGTGAAIPSKYRNVTGILLRNGDSSILMDCGEASLGQLFKRFGQDETEKILKSLRFVWISHIHADHHMGLASIIGARSRVLGEDCQPLLIIGPRPLRKMLGLYSALEPMKFSYVEASATEVRADDGACNGTEPSGPAAPVGASEDHAKTSTLLDGARASMGLKRLESVRVEHCSHAFALVLESSDFDHGASKGWKIVFSGDTRPCSQLTAAAANATVLIHEATFEDTMVEEAMEKRHSTTGEAIAAGRTSNSYMTFLTHFSQRYPKIPVIDDSFSGKVAVAFDLMTVRLCDLPRVPLITPGVKMLFEDEEEKERAAKHAHKANSE
jgi:ribonuclease Z